MLEQDHFRKSRGLRDCLRYFHKICSYLLLNLMENPTIRAGQVLFTTKLEGVVGGRHL